MGRRRAHLLGTGIAVSDDLEAIEEISLWGLAGQVVRRAVRLLGCGKETTKEQGCRRSGEPPALIHDRGRGEANGAAWGRE